MAREKSHDGFSEEERAAIRERATELKSSGARGAKKVAEDLEDTLTKIAEMSDDDRIIAETLHSIVTSQTPELAAKTWYGMPAYAKDGKVVVFFKAASKFKTRYAEVGFNEPATLDDGNMWPTAYAVTAMNATIKKNLAALVKKAAS